MTISTAHNQRIKNLEKLARDAIAQYNKEVAGGGEPLLPDWPLDLLALLDSYDRLTIALASQNLQPVDCVDFETRTVTPTLVKCQVKPSTTKGAQ